MNNITYIIPLHEFNSVVEDYIEKAFESIKNMKNSDKAKVIIVGPSDVISQAEIVYNTVGAKNKITLVKNTDSTEFSVQVNKGVMKCDTEYFTVLEFDDEYTDYWFDSVEEYLYEGNCVIMPLTEYVDTNKEFKCFANEIALSNSFTNEQGVLDIECLNAFMDYSVNGSVIKTETFKDLGMLKPSMKTAAWYEFLLRCCYNKEGVRVIPYVGYLHTINREGSYLLEESKKITPEEGSWLITTARQEYFFKEDRNKKFDREKFLNIDGEERKEAE